MKVHNNKIHCSTIFKAKKRYAPIALQGLTDFLKVMCNFAHVHIIIIIIINSMTCT